MRYQKSRPARRIPPVAYLALALYLCLFFVSAWFSSYQNQTALRLKREFELQRDRLQDEINKLEMQEAELTSVKRIRQIAEELEMVLPSEQAKVLRVR